MPALVSTLCLQQNHNTGVTGEFYELPLSKGHAEARRVNLYEGYLYFTVFADPPREFEAGHGAE